MPTCELSITLASAILSSGVSLSGNCAHITTEDASIVSTALVLLHSSADALLDNATLSSSTKVYASATLSAVLGDAVTERFSASLDGISAPYEDVLSWTGHPLTGSRVRVRTGNLYGIFGEPGEFGIFAGDGWDANSGSAPTWDSKYIRLGSYANEFHNIPVKLYDNGNVTIQLEPDAPSFAMGSPIPSGYDTGIGLWQGRDVDGIYKWRIGDPTEFGSSFNWDGDTLILRNSSFEVGGAAAHLAFGNPPPTSAEDGTGIWIDRTGFYGLNDGARQVFIDTVNGAFYAGDVLQDNYMRFLDDSLTLRGEINATSGTLNELDIIGTLEIADEGNIQIGAVDSSNIRIDNDKIIGDLGGSGNVQFILGNLNGYYGMSTDTWGLGVGLSDLSQSYIKFANNNLLIKASLESGNTTIDGTGITVLTDPAAGDGYTTIIEYGEDSGKITAVLEGATDTEEVRHRLRASDLQRAATQTIISESSAWSRIKLIASKLLMPAKQAIIELFSSGAGSRISLTAEKVEVLADTVEIKGGEVSQIAEPLGIPQANSMGKIDPSWLPVEEEPVGTFEIPGGAMVLWAGALAPTGFAFVTELDNQFVMGHTSTALGTALGSTTHSHTNPAAANGGGHSNHAMNISGSSIEYGSSAYAFPDKAWIVGQHSHPTGTGSYQSIAGDHGHTYPNTGTASNLPPYYRGLRWIRATANKVAPIGTIVMESAGADLGPDWAICDGTNGTPNLSDKFIYAAGSGTGGAKTHTHTTSGNSSSAGDHYHTIQVDSSSTDYTGSSEFGNPTASNKHSHRKVGAQSTNAGTHTHTVGTSGEGSTLPPYIVVRYWQRISTDNEAAFPSGVVLGTYASSVPLGYKAADTFYGYIPKGVYGAEIVGSRVGTAYSTNHNHIAGAISTAPAHSHAETAEITYDNAGGAQRSAASGSGETRVGTHTHTFTFNLGAAGAHTHTPDSQYTGSASALPPYKQVLFIIKDVPAPSGSLAVGGDLSVGGDATITGDLKDGDGVLYGRPVFLAAPLTSTSWDGDTKTTSDRAVVDLSSVFGVPAGVKAVLMSIQTQADAVNDYIRFGPNSTYNYALICRTQVAGVIAHAFGIVPCDANGDVYCHPSGTIEGVWVWILGYWL